MLGVKVGLYMIFQSVHWGLVPEALGKELGQTSE